MLHVVSKNLMPLFFNITLHHSKNIFLLVIINKSRNMGLMETSFFCPVIVNTVEDFSNEKCK